MACCSDRRAVLVTTPQLRAAAVAPPRVAPPAAGLGLRYRGGSELALRGPFSGRVYHIGPAAGAVVADPRDVEALLRTGLFERSAG